MSSFGLGYRMRRTLGRLARGNASYLVNALVAKLPEGARRLLFRGGRYRCPFCEAELSRFLPHGEGPEPASLCPVCFSLTRHRLVLRVFETQTNLFDGKRKRLLHLAPERQISAKLRQVENLDYLSADLDSPAAMEHFDITDIPHPDGSFEAIYCSHVLEHVPDDHKAMRELWRVLKPGGCALLLVPIGPGPTDEDPSVTDPAERERRFGQYDHVRRYGPDFKDRLEAAGFDVEVIDPAALDADRVAAVERAPRGEMHLCRKGN